MINASTVGLDGAYSFAGIKPGTYYVHASIAVYIDPFDEFTPEDFERAVTPPCAPALWPEFLRSPSTAQNLHASIEARPSAAAFLFDDGTPAAGWLLSITKPKATETQSDAVDGQQCRRRSLSAKGPRSPSPTTSATTASPVSPPGSIPCVLPSTPPGLASVAPTSAMAAAASA